MTAAKSRIFIKVLQSVYLLSFHISENPISKDYNLLLFLSNIRTNLFKSMTEINERTHKLLILAGDQSPAFQARDFAKLKQVIVNQYIASNKPAYQQFFLQIFPSVIRRVPLKQHIYSGLTSQINKINQTLSITIIKKVVQNLEKDLNGLKVHESINGILFLSELMNMEKLNSQCFFDVLDDIVTFVENCKNANHRAFFVIVFSRTLHNFCYSLNKKVYFQFKKLLERAKKYCYKNIEFSTILQHFQKGTVSDGSIIHRLLQAPPNPSTQHNQIQQKIRLNIHISEQTVYTPIQYHIPSTQESDKLYQQYQRNEGQLHLTNMQQIVELMKQYSSFMLEKLNNYVNYQSQKNSFMKRFFVDLVFGKGLKSNNTIVESFLLVRMVKNMGVYAGLVEGVLRRAFADIQTLDLGEEIKFAEIVSYVAYNWPTGSSDMTDIGVWDWQKFVRNSEDQFAGQQQIQLTPRKVALLKIIFAKLTLLSQTTKIPANLKKYCPPQDLRNPTKYKSVQQLQTLQNFQQQLKKKLNSEQMLQHIKNETNYEIFLEALFQKTSQSHTHLQILISRYQRVFLKFKEDCDWTLLNSIRSYWSKSLFHRLLYLSAVIQRGYVDFQSYVKYISKVDTSNQEEAHLVKLQLNELLNSFGQKLKSSA